MKEETRNLVSLVTNIISSISLISLGVFGYLVSSDVRTIQKEADHRARAKQAQEFWNDVYAASQAADDKSGALGSAITQFIFEGGKLLDNYRRTYLTVRPNLEVHPRLRSALRMNEVPTIITERVDDIPLLLEQMQRMGLPTL
jgi:hypothetical protein